MNLGIDKNEWTDIELFRVEVEEVFTVWYNHDPIGRFEFDDREDTLRVFVVSPNWNSLGVLRLGGPRRWQVVSGSAFDAPKVGDFMTLREGVLCLLGVHVSPRGGSVPS